MQLRMRAGSIMIAMLLLNVTVWGITEGIYGTDNRRYVCNAGTDSVYTTSEYMQAARSICLLVPKTIVDPQWPSDTGKPVEYPKGGFDVKLYGKLRKFLETEYSTMLIEARFKDDYMILDSAGIGTGFMIGDRQILTVDHIFDEKNPSEFLAVFNWIETRADATTIINFSPYFCFNLVGYDSYKGDTLKQISLRGSTDKMDLSVIKTDRIMDAVNGNIPPLSIYNEYGVKNKLVGKELFMIGHGMGLPQILTDDAFVNPNINLTQARTFVKNLVNDSAVLSQAQFDRLCFASLDGFEGNSGSPVFVKDAKFGWKVVGVFTGGPDDYFVDSSTSKRIVKERFYTKGEFDAGKRTERFQILEGFPPFKRDCTTDCDYITIPEEPIRNPQVKGKEITVKMPHLSAITNGLYFVVFATGDIKSGAKVIYFQGEPTPSKVTGRVPNGLRYDIKLLNAKSATVVYNFGITGTAAGNVSVVGLGFQTQATANGLVTSKVNLVPNIRCGEFPLPVNFIAYYPNVETVVSCLWDFGDGTTSAAMYPSHTYATYGTYAVNLTVQYPGFTEVFRYDSCIEVLDSKDLILLNGDVKKYPIFGISDVKINDRVKCIDNNQLPMPVACANGNISIGSQAKCGSLICRSGVWLRDYARVEGDIRCGATIVYQNNVVVTGKTEIHSTIPASELPSTLNLTGTISYTSGEMTGTVFVEPGNTCELTPGKYYNYSIKSNSKLKLCSGVYYFNNLELDAGSTMELGEIAGPIRIYVRSNISLKGKIVHSLAGAAGPRNFLVVYCGINRIYLDYGFSGTFVAPNAFLVMAQAVKAYEGCYYAKAIEVHQEAIVTYIPYMF